MFKRDFWIMYEHWTDVNLLFWRLDVTGGLTWYASNHCSCVITTYTKVFSTDGEIGATVNRAATRLNLGNTMQYLLHHFILISDKRQMSYINMHYYLFLVSVYHNVNNLRKKFADGLRNLIFSKISIQLLPSVAFLSTTVQTKEVTS